MFLSRIYYAIAYLIVLIWEIIKATVDMSLRILRAKGIERYLKQYLQTASL